MKAIYILWPEKNYTPQERKETLLSLCSSQLDLSLIQDLRVNIDDEFSQVKSPAPKFHRGPSIVATVSVKSNADVFGSIYNHLANAGFKVGCYTVEESIYTDYGDNQHFPARNWADGNKTPSVVVAVTLLTRPKKFNHNEWIRRWHGIMSPGSEAIQPRARYIRNVITKVEKDSPHIDGIVEESWPSAEHISNPYKFYLASNPFQLIWHMIKMLRLVTQFHQLHKIRTVTMSEYFLKTEDETFTITGGDSLVK